MNFLRNWLKGLIGVSILAGLYLGIGGGVWLFFNGYYVICAIEMLLVCSLFIAVMQTINL